MRSRTLLLAILVAIAAVCAQDRFGNEHGGAFKGFTKAPGEHIMNEFSGVPEVRSMFGRVFDDATGMGMAGVLFEFRRDDPSDAVRGVRTKKDGSFTVAPVPDGMYIFKATREGYQSVYGRLKVTRAASPKATLLVKLKQGV